MYKRQGQNVRLAAKLTGWKIDIKSEEEKRKEVEAQFGALEIGGGAQDAAQDEQTEDGQSEVAQAQDGQTEDGQTEVAQPEDGQPDAGKTEAEAEAKTE